MSLPRRTLRNQFFYSILLVGAAVALASQMPAPDSLSERRFAQPKAVVESEIKKLRSSASGQLPVLDGFALADNRPFERFSHGYYQCSVSVTSLPSGESLVRVKAKITAWYSAPTSTRSGYQVLRSNGRLESDFLDRLAAALASAPATSTAKTAARTEHFPQKTEDSETPLISAPTPQNANKVGSVLVGPAWSQVRPPFAKPSGSAAQPADPNADSQELLSEAKGLEAILQAQSHPGNLVAVKKTGTPVLAGPSEGAQVMFLAAAEDEYELLDVNANWVHVRISGLSRGWIRRSNVEMPESAATEERPPAPPSPAPPAMEAQFEIASEQVASFPGDWEPLRGKTVKIVSLQRTSAGTSSAESKLALAKSLFDKQYNELTQSASTAAGVVLIFDSADGGMMAATMPVLGQWKVGSLSDEALWRRCYFDPPELRGATQ